MLIQLNSCKKQRGTLHTAIIMNNMRND